MKEFEIRLTSVQDVQEFVSWATMQPYTITVGNETYRVNGSSFMGMFTLDHSKPLSVQVSCTDEQFRRLLEEAQRFLAK